MNLSQIFDTILRVVLRRAVSTGINKGIDLATGKGRAGGGAAPSGPATAAGRAQAQKARETAKLARKAAQLTRRLGR
jgi:hypothetical protein